MHCNKMDAYYPGSMNHLYFYKRIFHNSPVLFSIACHSQIKGVGGWGGVFELKNAEEFYLNIVSCSKILKIFKDPLSDIYVLHAWKSEEAIKKRGVARYR